MKAKDGASRAQSIRIIIADDHPVVREGLSAMIQLHPDMEIVAEASDGKTAVRDYFAHRPDVTLLDMRMPEMGGLEAMRVILEKDPQARIIAISSFHPDEDLFQALNAGAMGFLVKDAPREQIYECIRVVFVGGKYLAPSLSTQFLSGVARQRLTQRETEVVRLIASGKTNKEIASQLRITEGTVKAHLTNLFGKLRAAGRTDAIRIARDRGIVQ